MQELEDSNWRQNYKEVGDSPDESLRVVRDAAIRIKSFFPSANTELVVLDSLDWFVMVDAKDFDGQMGHCEDETVYITFDAENKVSLYEDDVPLSQLCEKIRDHFGII